MKNIILIGMPTCGKSTVGVLLAKALGYSFCDTDLLIQSKHRKLLREIMEERGTAGFLCAEEDVLLGYDITLGRTVIATGGSAVYSEAGMKHLKENGITFYISVCEETITRRLTDITSRGVVMPDGMTLADVYSQRLPLYEKFADITLFADNMSVEECVSKIAGRIALIRSANGGDGSEV